MSESQLPYKLEITDVLAKKLIAEQFPQWTNLPIEPVALSGIDNRTFRLGKDMLIRLPSAEGYAAQVQKEQKWLPALSPHLSFAIPQPLAMGKPSDHYPWNWSVYRWIEGQSANSLSIDNQHLQDIALQLGQFLNELHKIDIKDAPLPGLHNYWRGAHPSVYDEQTRESISALKGHIDANAAIACWERAISSKWNKSPVWVHGDFASGNILIRKNKLAAIIDFGCMGIGDPACDLVIAWTFLDNKSRKIFQSQVNIDPDTWARVRGWALWKACFELVAYEDKTSPEALKRKQIITEVINDK